MFSIKAFKRKKMSYLTNTQVIYTQIPNGLPNPDTDFAIKKSKIVLAEAKLQPHHALIRTLYLSMDPYMRTRLRGPTDPDYWLPPAETGKPFFGWTIGEVVKSSDPKYKEGDIIIGFSNWEKYSIVPTQIPATAPQVIPNARSLKFPLSYFMGILGLPGMTAYIGLQKICQPFIAGQNLFVSAASGAVGQVVGQYAKNLGLRAVGSAGSDEKVNYLLKELGFDAAFNYKKYNDADFVSILKETCPNGFDIYFDNVGGKMLDAVLEVANDYCRVAACGMMSQDGRRDNLEAVPNIYKIITKRIRIEGFMAMDDTSKYQDEGIKTFTQLLLEGKMKYKEDVTVGIEKTPHAFVDVLTGKNFGKSVVKVADL